MAAGTVGRHGTDTPRKRRLGGGRLAARLLSTTALAGATALVGLAAPAGASEWTGALSSDWFTAGNWVGGVPTGTDLVTIDPLSGVPVLIDGAAAVADDMYLGLFNSGELTILNGGTLTNSGFGHVGYGFVTTGMVTVTGAGSMWTAADIITVGYGGTGEVNLTDGGTLLAGDLTLGGLSGATGTVTVSGTGSFLSAAAIIVGDEGTGTLTIEDGASALASGLTSLGHGVGGMGTMVVTGAGSTFSSFDNLIVGNQGEGELWVADGATTTFTDVFAGFMGGGADGLIRIEGTNSTLNAQGLYLGNDAGAVGGLLMSGGAKLNTTEGSLGSAAGSTGIASLTGAGTFWTNSLDLFVGEDGNGTLAVSDGAGIGTGTFQVGANAGSIGIVGLTGSGSAINVLNAATVGNEGEGLLTVGDGATFDVSGDLTVGGLAGGIGAVLATGADTTVSLNNLTVAGAGGAIFHVQNGATVDAGLDLTIAADAGSTGYLYLGGTSGGVTQGAGTLLAANGITFGDGNGALIFQHTGADYQFGLDIAGSGQIFALEGVTRYGGDASGFTGTTEIHGGATLDVLGTLLGTTSILSDGRLGGDGTLGIVDVQSGGTVAPGNSIGTVDVTDVTFAAGSIYEVEVNSLGDSDLINAAGTATINGGTVSVLAFPDYALGTAYTILTAGTVTGTFDGATASVFVTPTLSYDANNAYVTLAQTASFTDVALTPNQIAAAGGAESLGAGNDLFDAILALGSAAEAQAAFDAVSGEIHASLQTALIEDSRFVREAAAGRIRAAFEGVAAESVPVLAYGDDVRTIAPADTDRFAVWGQAFGSFGHWENDGNAAAFDRTTGGFLIGGDAFVGNDWRLGVLAGYSRTGFDADDRASSGDSDNIHLGVYGGTKVGALGLRFGGAYAWHDVDTSRMAAFTGFAETLTAAYDAGTAQAFAEAGYEIRAGSARFEPFANLAYVDLTTDGFTETGGTAALTAASSSADTTFATLGLRAETSFVLGGMMATARGTVGWRHAFGDLVPTAGLAFAGGAAFTVAGVPIAEDALVLEAGVDVLIAPTATLGFDYSGQIGSDMSDHAMKANLGVRF